MAFDPRTDLAPAARLFGRLCVRELDAATLAELQQPDVAATLRELGVTVPADADLQQLAHEWLECFLHPAGSSPPVHSLFRDGHYNGDPAVAIAQIARAAGLELAAGARNAPPDQIGCVLLLWAELAHDHPDLADRLVAEHMAWAERALHPAAARGGFYGAVARATAALVAELVAPPSPRPPFPPLAST